MAWWVFWGWICSFFRFSCKYATFNPSINALLAILIHRREKILVVDLLTRIKLLCILAILLPPPHFIPFTLKIISKSTFYAKKTKVWLKFIKTFEQNLPKTFRKTVFISNFFSKISAILWKWNPFFIETYFYNTSIEYAWCSII